MIRTSPDQAILFFPRTATGNTAPIRTIVGGATGINGPIFHSYFPALVSADGFESGDVDGWSSTGP